MKIITETQVMPYKSQHRKHAKVRKVKKYVDEKGKVVKVEVRKSRIIKDYQKKKIKKDQSAKNFKKIMKNIRNDLKEELKQSIEQEKK